jgi:hypothetical protein
MVFLLISVSDLFHIPDEGFGARQHMDFLPSRQQEKSHGPIKGPWLFYETA